MFCGGTTCDSIKAQPRLFLTHVKNRGGLLLSLHNVHKDAAGIKAAGADLAQLGNAWATELADSGPSRKLTIENNTSLIQRSERILCHDPLVVFSIALRYFMFAFQTKTIE